MGPTSGTERDGPGDHALAVLGILLRVDWDGRQQCVRILEGLSGMTVFDVSDPLRLGVIIERASMEDAERALHDEVERVPGVLGAWPVFMHAEDIAEATTS
ncbi:MAG: hypothetical protein R3E01_31040 [Pirellulaceae bacterium]